MKELKMFPQITEETEENLLNLEEVDPPTSKSPPPPSPTSSSGSPPDVPSSPTHENNISLPLPTIIAEDVDIKQNNNSILEDEFSSPPPRIRIRSLSGGAYRITPVPASGRMRRQSGDDVLTGVSPSRKAALFELPEKLHFRPRSKSDSKGKRPTFLTTLKNSIFSSNFNQRKNSLEQETLEPLQPGDYRQRSRSGSETKGGTMSKMIDMFRSRSNSISMDLRGKKPAVNSAAAAASALMRRYSVDPDRRRHPPVLTHRSLELPGDHRSGDPEGELEEINYEGVAEDLLIPKFFDCNNCYNIMPLSGKMVVLDMELTVEKAFHCLVGNEIRAAPIWNSSRMEFIGMLTVTDFINVLILYYNSSEERMKNLENQTIQTWRRITNKTNNFIHINPEVSLTEAIKTLVQRQVHRLPVINPVTKDVLFIVTHKRILTFLSIFVLGKSKVIPSYMKKSIRELRIGTYENIATATLNTTVIEALNIFVERKVSALPVIQNDAVINIYAKFDVLTLANEKTYSNLDVTIRQALQERGEVYEKVFTCTLEDTLDNVIDKIVKSGVHRIVVVDSNQSVIGMISLSDILTYLVLRPLGLLDVPVSTLSEGGDCTAEELVQLVEQDMATISEGIETVQLEQATSSVLAGNQNVQDDQVCTVGVTQTTQSGSECASVTSPVAQVTDVKFEESFVEEVSDAEDYEDSSEN